MNCKPIKDIPQDRLLCLTHVNNKKKQVFENFLFKCVTRPDIGGVRLTKVVSHWDLVLSCTGDERIVGLQQIV